MSTTSGRSARQRRVYTWQSTPAWASDATSSRTYTFMPPPSPVAGLHERGGVEGEHSETLHG